MKNIFRASLVLLLILAGYINNSCTKDRPKLPIVTTGAATNIKAGTATLNGTINPNGMSATVSFEYGITKSYGNSKYVTQTPLAGELSISVNTVIEGLASMTTYHYRLKAENASGISFGEDNLFINDCMFCKHVTYENGVIINESSEISYCGPDVQTILNIPPVTVGNSTAKYICR
jgi:hypothetical protein